jgi:ketosteroid isomerase-like protein
MTRVGAHEHTLADTLCAAVNAHDLDRVVARFTEDYVNETPAHPARSFRGREQVRRNWQQIFAAVPDIEATVLRSDQVGDRVWSEWEMRGTRGDGAEHLLRGVMILTVAGDQASAVRFYLEPVDADRTEADQAIAQLLTDPRS